MTKNIKDLTNEEMDKICSAHNKKGTSCLNDYEQNIKCPLYYKGTCIRTFINMTKFIEKEIEIDE